MNYREIFKVNNIGMLLLCIYVSSMFLSRDNCDNSLLYLAFIASLCPAKIIGHESGSNDRPFISNITLSLKTINLMQNPLSVCLVVYAGVISLRSIFADGPTLSVLHQNLLVELLPLLILISLFNRYSAEYDDYCTVFFSLICPAAIINLYFNLTHYYYTTGGYTYFLKNRFGFPSIGIATGTVATTFALVYGVMSIGVFLAATKTKIILYKIFLYYSSAFLAIGVILTQSRGVAISAFLIILIYLFENKNSYRKYYYYLISAIVLLVIFYFYFGGRMAHDGNRVAVWSQALELALQRPWIGYGELVFQNPITSSPAEKLQQGHNFLLNAELRGGISALLLITFVFYVGLLRCFELKKLFRIETPFYVFLFVLISGCVDYDIVVRNKDWDWIALWLPLGLALGANTYLTVRGYPYKMVMCDKPT